MRASIHSARGRLLLDFLKQQGRQVDCQGTKGRKEQLLCTLNVNVVCPYWPSKPLFHFKHILQRSPQVILSFRTAEKKKLTLFSCSQALPPLYNPLQKNRLFSWNCLAYAQCESSFTERIYRAFYTGMPSNLILVQNGTVL